MEGYIKSLSTGWRHIFKRAVRPGGQIPLEELYETYGKKYDLKEGDEFVSWLKDVKLKGLTDTWTVILLNDEAPEELVAEVEVKEEEDDDSGFNHAAVIKNMTVEDIVLLSVRKAREVIPKITDLKLLKYALQEANPRAGKDSLCRILDKRIKEVNIAR